MGFYSFAERKDQTLKPLWKKNENKNVFIPIYKCRISYFNI